MAWFGRKPSSSRDTLAARLQDYPAFPLPHVGAAAQLTDSQARENLEVFLQARPQRLAALLDLLRAEGVDTGFESPHAGFDPTNVAEQLFRWGKERWGTLPPLARHARANWVDTAYGADRVDAMMRDVALMLGESITRAAPGWRWVVDLEPRHIRRELESARRIVLLADPVGGATEPYIVDPDLAVLSFRLDMPDMVMLNEWALMVDDAVSGAYQAHDRVPPSAAG